MFKMQVLVIPRLQPNQHLFCTHLRAKVCIVCSATCLNCYNVFFCWYLSIFCVFSNRFQHLFGTRLLKLKKKSKKHLWKPLRKNTLSMDLSESLALACPCFIWHLLCYGSLLRNSFFHHHPQSFAQRTVPGWPCALSRPPAPCASPILLSGVWTSGVGVSGVWTSCVCVSKWCVCVWVSGVCVWVSKCVCVWVSGMCVCE